jgi:hypothetical protein
MRRNYMKKISIETKIAQPQIWEAKEKEGK